MASRSYVLIFVTIFLGLILHFPPQAEATKFQSLLKNICQQSPDYGFCFRTLSSNPKISSVSNINVKTIAEIALGTARKESINVGVFFDGMVNRKDINPAFKPALKMCSSYFKEAIGFLNLRGLDGDTASLDVHYGLDSAQSCETALAAARVHIQSIPPKIQNWKNLFSVAYAAVVTLED